MLVVCDVVCVVGEFGWFDVECFVKWCGIDVVCMCVFV